MQSTRFLLDGYDSQTAHFDYRKWATHTDMLHIMFENGDANAIHPLLPAPGRALQLQNMFAWKRSWDASQFSTLTVDKTKITTKNVENSGLPSGAEFQSWGCGCGGPLQVISTNRIR